jgi:5-methylthioadenosine/S-adenosylhomocysteine deaminase
MTISNKRLDRIQDGYILFSNQIDEVGPYSEEVGVELLEKYGSSLEILGSNTDNPTINDIKQINGVALPGFVKGHGHDHESVLIGVARDLPLTSWLDEAINLFTGFMHENQEKLTAHFGNSPYYVAYLKARLDDICFGITTAVTHHCNFNKYHVDELVEANSVIGTRIFIAVGSQDRHYDDRILDTPSQAVDRLDAYYEKHKNNERVTIIPGPDQLFSNGPELLKALKKWANEHDCIIHIHSSEEPATTKWFTETYGKTPIEYASSIGFLDEKTLLAHQVNNTENDLETIANSGAMVVHNPLANTILGSGMPPILKMIEKDIPVCISTDGSGSADNQNMLSAARLASQYQKAFHKDAKVMEAEDVLQRITSKPAEMFGINAGTLVKGKDADLIIVDLSKPNLTPTRLETVVENLIWASAGNEISYVIANGHVLIDEYQFKSINKDEILKNIQKLADLFEEYKVSAEKISGTGVHS